MAAPAPAPIPILLRVRPLGGFGRLRIRRVDVVAIVPSRGRHAREMERDAGQALDLP